jgi:hypothetical protein
MKKVYRDTLNTKRDKNDREKQEFIAKLRRLPSDEKNEIIKILQE